MLAMLKLYETPGIPVLIFIKKKTLESVIIFFISIFMHTNRTDYISFQYGIKKKTGEHTAC